MGPTDETAMTEPVTDPAVVPTVPLSQIAHAYAIQLVCRALGMLASVVSVAMTAHYLGPGLYGLLTIAVVFIGLWFLIQLFQGTVQLLLPSSSGGVAWWAHVGGFVAGLVLIPFFQRAPREYRVYYPDEGVLGFDPSGRP